MARLAKARTLAYLENKKNELEEVKEVPLSPEQQETDKKPEEIVEQFQPQEVDFVEPVIEKVASVNDVIKVTDRQFGKFEEVGMSL